MCGGVASAAKVDGCMPISGGAARTNFSGDDLDLVEGTKPREGEVPFFRSGGALRFHPEIFCHMHINKILFDVILVCLG